MSSRHSRRGLAAKSSEAGRAGVGAAACLRPEERPETPHKVKKFRRTYFAEPGKRVVHPGMIDDALPVPEGKSFGCSTKSSEHISDVFAAAGSAALTPAELLASRRGAAADDGIGRSKRHTDVPIDEHAVFGARSRVSESAKHLLYPSAGPAALSGVEDEDTLARYKRTHGRYDPGEQKKHGYDWSKTGADPVHTRFGSRGVVDELGARGCLAPETDPAIHKTRLVSLQQEAFRAMTGDELGRSKKRSAAAMDPDRVFGASRRAARGGEPEWGAADCIAGGYTAEEQEPDEDLGHAVSAGFRNVAKETRSFGVPTVRLDIKPPAKRSIADDKNFGDDADAASLLCPSRFAGMGIDDADFVLERSPDFIRDVFVSIGYDLSDDAVFDKLWHRAATAYDLNGDGIVSVEEFRRALEEYQEAIEDGVRLDWW
eukprot:PLAT14616.1.p1 GENE.PLAT14616.1~~PLAT14616.1.p1  ORF type:complete len:442 (+),score=170.44 PLAT14616.1:41-1327(+)